MRGLCSNCGEEREIHPAWAGLCISCAPGGSSLPKSVIRTTSNLRDYQRNYYLKRMYGITLDQYNLLLEYQERVCSICREEEHAQFRGRTKPLSVDHDSDTGRVRGLLCLKCNLAVGSFDHDTERLQRAAMYLSETPADLIGLYED